MTGSGSCLYVGDLDRTIDDERLRLLFNASNSVVEAKVVRDKGTGESNGFGFVEFTTPQAAEMVFRTYNGIPMPGYPDRYYKLNWAQYGISSSSDGGGSKMASSEKVLFVIDLTPDVNDYVLSEAFRASYPSATQAQVLTDPITLASRGYGFVWFASQEELARAAVEMNGRVLTTHPMQTYLATSAFVGSSALEVMNGFDPSNTTVFVGSLSDPTITEEDLENLFSTFGQVSGTRIVTAKKRAFITFGTHDAAFRSILLLSGTQLKTSTLRLSWGRGQGSGTLFPAGYKPPQSAAAPASVAPAAVGTDPSQAAAQYPYYGYYGYSQQQPVSGDATAAQTAANGYPYPYNEGGYTAQQVEATAADMSYSAAEATRSGDVDHQAELNSIGKKPIRWRPYEEDFTNIPDYEEDSRAYLSLFSSHQQIPQHSILFQKRAFSDAFLDTQGSDLP
eukprot:CAMPEP_0113908268 /NCGR_PEP_ID=MMETSP0780_2-20120614/26050_1 /TAXON_ID=652834 /ORGANISM="Palpitomonas bilix" /LENGTH=448 /DNA_ID=CAMNT_0000903643 /DNA_START=106 /DNA_END=1453 /DNA_ORIENTATION=- /assembly_acc=CAM_ASM_000599